MVGKAKGRVLRCISMAMYQAVRFGSDKVMGRTAQRWLVLSPTEYLRTQGHAALGGLAA